MITYLSKNVIKGDFSMNNAKPFIGLSEKPYDITDLFDEHEHIEKEEKMAELLNELEFHKFQN